MTTESEQAAGHAAALAQAEKERDQAARAAGWAEGWKTAIGAAKAKARYSWQVTDLVALTLPEAPAARGDVAARGEPRGARFLVLDSSQDAGRDYIVLDVRPAQAKALFEEVERAGAPAQSGEIPADGRVGVYVEVEPHRQVYTMTGHPDRYPPSLLRDDIDPAPAAAAEPDPLAEMQAQEAEHEKAKAQRRDEERAARDFVRDEPRVCDCGKPPGEDWTHGSRCSEFKVETLAAEPPRKAATTVDPGAAALEWAAEFFTTQNWSDEPLTSKEVAEQLRSLAGSDMINRPGRVVVFDASNTLPATTASAAPRKAAVGAEPGLVPITDPLAHYNATKGESSAIWDDEDEALVQSSGAPRKAAVEAEPRPHSRHCLNGLECPTCDSPATAAGAPPLAAPVALEWASGSEQMRGTPPCAAFDRDGIRLRANEGARQHVAIHVWRPSLAAAKAEAARIYARAFGPRLSPEEAAALGRVLDDIQNAWPKAVDLATLAPLLEGGKP